MPDASKHVLWQLSEEIYHRLECGLSIDIHTENFLLLSGLLIVIGCGQLLRLRHGLLG